MLNKVKERLESVRMMYTESVILHGVKLTLPNNVFITVYNKGTVLVQGNPTNASKVKQLLGL